MPVHESSSTGARLSGGKVIQRGSRWLSQYSNKLTCRLKCQTVLMPFLAMNRMSVGTAESSDPFT